MFFITEAFINKKNILKKSKKRLKMKKFAGGFEEEEDDTFESDVDEMFGDDEDWE